jgi:hypothetical protein
VSTTDVPVLFRKSIKANHANSIKIAWMKECFAALEKYVEVRERRARQMMGRLKENQVIAFLVRSI